MVFTMDTYREHPGINHSTLKAFAKGAAHVKHQIENGTVETDAMRLGTLFHLLVLEPERQATDVAVAPKVNRRTKAGKEELSDWEKQSVGKIIVTEEQLATAIQMRQAVADHPAAGPIIESLVHREVDVYWTDPFFRMQCKAKVDGISETSIVDLKTTIDATPSGFTRAIFNHYYHTQASWYMQGVHTAAIAKPTDFIFIAVEKVAPFEVGVYRVGADAMQAGLITVTKWLSDYYERSKTSDWVSFPEVVQVEVPAWIQNNL
jgi:hypothetical protein